MPAQTVYHTNEALFQAYHLLQPGDIVLGRLRLRASEESLVADLLSRNIHLIPSGLSQLASRSKCLQVALFGKEFLAPLTMAIHDKHDMQQALARYGHHCKQAVITKLDRKNAGLGVCKWSSVEEVYNAATLQTLPFPFVLQPYLANCRDIRVILLGAHYREAYERINVLNFRNNLHFGGESRPFQLSAEIEKFCHRVMQRGQFPYAHLDLLLFPDGKLFLNEINLRGGMRGADIEKQKYYVPLDKFAQEQVKAVYKNGILKVTIPPKEDTTVNEGIKIEIIKEGE